MMILKKRNMDSLCPFLSSITLTHTRIYVRVNPDSNPNSSITTSSLWTISFVSNTKNYLHVLITRSICSLKFLTVHISNSLVRSSRLQLMKAQHPITSRKNTLHPLLRFLHRSSSKILGRMFLDDMTFETQNRGSSFSWEFYRICPTLHTNDVINSNKLKQYRSLFFNLPWISYLISHPSFNY